MAYDFHRSSMMPLTFTFKEPCLQSRDTRSVTTVFADGLSCARAAVSARVGLVKHSRECCAVW